MKSIQPVYENDVFRPSEPARLPQNPPVVSEPTPEKKPTVRELAPKGIPEGLLRIYEVMAERFDSGQNDVAERHNEHQP